MNSHTPEHAAAIANLLAGMTPERSTPTQEELCNALHSSAPDPVLTMLRELQCRVDDLATQVAHLVERSDHA